MFHFFSKTLISRHKTLDFKTIRIFHLHTTVPSLNSVPNPANLDSVTIAYLTNSCGLSLENAISASKKFQIENTKNADSVLESLVSHGFTKSDIVHLIAKVPQVLKSRPEKNLGPKIEFFKSMGIVGPDLLRFLVSNKMILNYSLKNQIEPAFCFLKGLVQTNENVIRALKQSSRVVTCRLEKLMVPNISTLRKNCVPKKYITRLVVLRPSALIWKPDVFESKVESVKEMGFDPQTMLFLLALKSMCEIGKLKWESKKKILMSFGWSEDDFHSAFKKQPLFMTCSEKKLGKLMDYFTTKMGLKPLDIVRCPNLLLVSLEKRVIPRIAVLNVLMSKDLLKKKNFNVVCILNKCKMDFEKEFVVDYVERFPELMKAYNSVQAL